VTDETAAHEPDTDRHPTVSNDAKSDEAGTPSSGVAPRNTPTDPDTEFDWRGWLLVAAVVLAFLVVPGILYVLPAAQGAIASLGLGLRHTYLVLPLVPAFVLGIIAVWSAVRSRSR